MAGVGILAVVLSVLVVLQQGGVQAAPVVDAPWGRIAGLDSVSVSGLNYSSYLAIPYAVPPLGDLRFAKPQAHPGYVAGQLFNASFPGSACIQEDTGLGYLTSEDCLTLNVYVPISTTGPKTVMIWIHGGAFIRGSARLFTPSELVSENDVIVVIIQYRLNALGFLSSGDDVIPGNFGLWDQALAIQWVKDNIGAFGGDPDSLTLFGVSAGAVSVGYHVLTPKWRGMKFKAILQSGTPLIKIAVNKNPAKTFEQMAEQTGCLRTDSWSSGLYRLTPWAQQRATNQEVLACLRRLDARFLMRIMNETIPVVDGDFVPRDPAVLMKDADYLDGIGATTRDIMIGVSNNEGSTFTRFQVSTGNTETGGGSWAGGLRGDLVRNQLQENLFFQLGEDLEKAPRSLDTLLNVLQFFYSSAQPGQGVALSIQDLSDTFSDRFVISAVQFARALATAQEKNSFRNNLGRVYLYLFNHYPSFKLATPQLSGMGHAEDVAYQFDPKPELGGRAGFNSDDFAVASTFRAMQTSFAKTGQPQISLFSQTGSVWPEFKLADERYLSLERVPRVEDHLFAKRVALWTELVPSVYQSTQVEESTPLWHHHHRSLRRCHD